MDKEDELKCLIGSYLGVKLMDEYDLKVYILKELETIINNFVNENKIKNYQEKLSQYEKELSTKTKLQDSLLILNQINAPMELIFLIKKRLRKLKK